MDIIQGKVDKVLDIKSKLFLDYTEKKKTCESLVKQIQNSLSSQDIGRVCQELNTAYRESKIAEAKLNTIMEVVEIFENKSK